MIKQAWAKKYAPATLDDVIFSDAATERTFRRYIADGSIPNLLLQGSQGTGKTSLSTALINDLGVVKADVLRINCSDEKIEAMRTKVGAFANTMPLGEFKVVQLEECDYLGGDAMALLRSLIESVSDNCRFIATCNYINKVIPALRSRFTEFTFNAPSEELVLVRAAEILEKEKVEFELDVLEKVVSAAYPDVRKVITLLERFSGSGALVIAEVDEVSDWKLALLPLLETRDLRAARKLVCESASKEELIDVYRFIYSNVARLKLKQEDQAIILIAQYQYQHAFVADAELQVAALFIELGQLA